MCNKMADPENTLTERSHLQKITYWMISFTLKCPEQAKHLEYLLLKVREM